MAEKKEQKIIVLVENEDSDKILILHGIKLAGAFKKELCFLFIQPENKKSKSNQISEKLEGYRKVVSTEIPTLRVSFLILTGKPENFIEDLADKHEAVLIITRNSMFNKLSQALKVSPIPILFVNERQTEIPDYKKIVLPIDLRKETKDAVLWASYFARFNNSGINVLAATDKNKENIRSVAKNILSIKNLFSKLNIAVKVFKGKQNSLNIQFEALELAQSSRADLVIVLGSSYISFIDLLIGLPEKKMIKKAEELPILIINPRKDMYILCD
jgi:hypothetical protein